MSDTYDPNKRPPYIRKRRKVLDDAGYQISVEFSEVFGAEGPFTVVVGKPGQPPIARTNWSAVSKTFAIDDTIILAFERHALGSVYEGGDYGHPV